MSARTGIGYDSHRFEEGRPLVLGGVEIQGAERGLAGHSDADVLAHAVIDALLGAAGLGRHRAHFPDTDERWRGADSIELLRAVRGLLARGRGRSAERGRHGGLRGAQAGPHRDADARPAGRRGRARAGRR